MTGMKVRHGGVVEGLASFNLGTRLDFLSEGRRCVIGFKDAVASRVAAAA